MQHGYRIIRECVLYDTSCYHRQRDGLRSVLIMQLTISLYCYNIIAQLCLHMETNMSKISKHWYCYLGTVAVFLSGVAIGLLF